MVSYLTTFINKGSPRKEKKFVFGQILRGSGGFTTRIRRLCNKDHEVMFSDAIIEPLQKTFDYKGCKTTAHFFLSADFALLTGLFWYQCYYPHRSRDALSPVCGFFSFFYNYNFQKGWHAEGQNDKLKEYRNTNYRTTKIQKRIKITENKSKKYINYRNNDIQITEVQKYKLQDDINTS